MAGRGCCQFIAMSAQILADRHRARPFPHHNPAVSPAIAQGLGAHGGFAGYWERWHPLCCVGHRETLVARRWCPQHAAPRMQCGWKEHLECPIGPFGPARARWPPLLLQCCFRACAGLDRKRRWPGIHLLRRLRSTSRFIFRQHRSLHLPLPRPIKRHPPHPPRHVAR